MIDLMTKAEYARRRGVTHGAVCNAVRRGKISTIGGKIDPGVADLQWEMNRQRAPKMPQGNRSALTVEMIDTADLRVWDAIESPHGNIERAVTDWVGLFIADIQPHATMIDNLRNLLLFISECAAHRARLNASDNQETGI